MSALDRFVKDEEKGFLDIIALPVRVRMALFSSLYEQNAAVITAALLSATVMLSVGLVLDTQGLSLVIPIVVAVILLAVGTPGMRNKRVAKSYIKSIDSTEKSIFENKAAIAVLGILYQAGYRGEHLKDAFEYTKTMNLKVNQYIEIESARRFALLIIAAGSAGLSPSEYFSIYDVYPDPRLLVKMREADIDTELIRSVVA